MARLKQNKTSKHIDSLPRIDHERTALRYTFTKLLSEHQRDVVRNRFESRFNNKLNIVVPLTRAEILNVLEGLFGSGAYMLISEFDRKSDELRTQQIGL